MKLLRLLTPPVSFAAGTVATIGNFDGVHRGHQALLAQLRQQADQLSLPVALLLFEPQPQEYFQGQNAPSRLTYLRDKLYWLKNSGVDYVCCLKFNKELAQMSAEDFAEHYFFEYLQARYLLIGEDFCFGKNRTGERSLLTKMATQFDCKVDVFPSFFIDQQRVSSTTIRQMLTKGELQQAKHLLGHSLSFCSRVIQGEGRGRQWGIPTANLCLRGLSLPLRGVFYVEVERENGLKYSGVANIGSRPTINGSKTSLEIHLLDFNENLYKERLNVFFLHKLREEIKFSSIEALVAQIHYDIATARSLESE